MWSVLALNLNCVRKICIGPPSGSLLLELRNPAPKLEARRSVSYKCAWIIILTITRLLQLESALRNVGM